jgi:purine nucleosidase
MPADEFRLRHRAAVPPAPVLLEMAEAFFLRRRHVTFNDPLAAVAVFAPDVCTYEPGVITLNVDRPGEEAARTFFAADRATPDRSSSQRVARGVKLERFFDEYVSTLGGRLTAGDFLPGGPSL